MARINIEECWWSDPRRSKLIRLLGGDTRTVDGLAIEAWRLAQEFWKHDRKLVPLSQFEALEGSAYLIEAGLAVIHEDAVYIRGSSQYLEWVNEEREKARLGGLRSAEVRREKYGSAQPIPNPTRTTLEPNSKPIEASDSVSGSIEETEIKNQKNHSVGEDADASSTQVATKSLTKLQQKVLDGAAAKTFVASYVSAYQTKFPGGRPEDLRDGKVRGQILNWIKDYPMDRACQLIQVYFQMDTKWFDTKGYDFLTFRNNLNKIGQALDSGRDPDGNQINWNKLRERAGA